MDKPQTETDYFYQDGTVLYTKDADGNRSSMNLLGISANVIATSRGTGNSESWYLYNKDIRESTTSIIGANGTAAATYEYDDFGNTMVTSGRNFDNEICYTGQIYDQSSGLYYYNARFYDPENARFLTQDTYRGEATQPDTLHLYAYCKNNPINYTDPSGHDAIWLNSRNGACKQGHAALMIEHSKKWYLFSWERKGYQSKYVKNAIRFKGAVKKNNKKVTKKINKHRPRNKPYTSSIYIKGDFSKSYSFWRNKVAKGKSYKKYHVKTTNCAWMAIHVLKQSYGKNVKDKFWKLQWRRAYRATSYKYKKLIRPNSVVSKIKNITGGTKKSIAPYY